MEMIYNPDYDSIYEMNIQIKEYYVWGNYSKKFYDGTKSIQLKYTNSNLKNEKAAKYVENLNLPKLKYIETNLEEMKEMTPTVLIKNVLEKYYTKQINDNSIHVDVAINYWRCSSDLNIYTIPESILIRVFKDEILYRTFYYNNCIYTIPVINVPKSIEDDKVKEYISNYISKYNESFASGILKIEKGINNIDNIDSSLYKNVEDGYTVTSSIINETCTQNYIIIKRVEKEYQLGDVNGDEKINAQDATLILKYLAKKVELTDEQLALADTDRDGRVKASDAVRILKYVAKKISEI